MEKISSIKVEKFEPFRDVIGMPIKDTTISKKGEEHREFVALITENPLIKNLNLPILYKLALDSLSYLLEAKHYSTLNSIRNSKIKVGNNNFSLTYPIGSMPSYLTTSEKDGIYYLLKIHGLKEMSGWFFSQKNIKNNEEKNTSFVLCTKANKWMGIVAGLKDNKYWRISLIKARNDRNYKMLCKRFTKTPPLTRKEGKNFIRINNLKIQELK